jgi:hypothetical protein
MAQEATKLMPGEDPLSIHVEDAEHWLAVYAELVAMAGALVKPPPSQKPGSPAADARNPEMMYIQERLAALEHRLEFWRQRLEQLEAVG